MHFNKKETKDGQKMNFDQDPVEFALVADVDADRYEITRDKTGN
jgi:hypothetical protein